MRIKYIIKKSLRAKNIMISVCPGGKVVVTKPYFVNNFYVARFLREKESWIIKARTRQENKQIPTLKTPRKEFLQNNNSAKKFVQERVAHFSKIYKLCPNKIYIRNQKTRWGSCSSKRNLSFNWKLIKLPKDLADYVVVHELCHLKELNHSHNFWTLVSKAIPNYKGLRKQIRKFGLSLS